MTDLKEKAISSNLYLVTDMEKNQSGRDLDLTMKKKRAKTLQKKKLDPHFR
jgi:hypothetical protein